MTESTWPNEYDQNLVNMIKKLTTTNNNMVNMTKKIYINANPDIENIFFGQ